MASMIYNTVNLFQKKHKENFSLIINYLFIAYAFSMPISGAITNTIFTTIFILWLIHGDIKNKFIYAFKHKFIQALILFYLIHFLWLWSSDNTPFAIETIKNSRFLLYAIIYITSIKREFVFKILNGFIYAMIFSEMASYLIHFQIIAPINNATVVDPVPFVLSHTTYALYLGISVGLALFMALQQHHTKLLKLLYSIFFITATINIFIIASRLGFILYFTSISLVLIFIYKKNIKKIFLIGIPLVLITYMLAYTYSPVFKQRITQTINNTQKVIENKNFGTSIGNRVGHWYYGLKVASNNFLFGVGDGDQIDLMKHKITAENDPSKNSLFLNLQNGIHSEILDIFVKFGLVGLLIYLNIYYQLFRLKPKDDIFNLLKLILISVFLLSAIQGGALVLAVKDLGKLFTLLSVLVIINSIKMTDKD